MQVMLRNIAEVSSKRRLYGADGKSGIMQTSYPTVVWLYKYFLPLHAICVWICYWSRWSKCWCFAWCMFMMSALWVHWDLFKRDNANGFVPAIGCSWFGWWWLTGTWDTRNANWGHQRIFGVHLWLCTLVQHMCVGSQHTRAGANFFFWHWFCTAQSMVAVNP